MYTKAGKGKSASAATYALDDPLLSQLLDRDLYEQLLEEVELLQVRARLCWLPAICSVALVQLIEQS